MILVFACSIFPSSGAIRKAALAFFFFALVIPASAWGLFASALSLPVSALDLLVPACFKAGFGRFQATLCRLQAMTGQNQATPCWIQAFLGKAEAVIGRLQAVSMWTSSRARRER